MTILGAGLTDIGYKRKHNEDAFLCDVPFGLFIVADGMGGRAAGEAASKAVTTLVPIMLKEKLQSVDPSHPKNLIATLSKTLCQLSQNLYQQAQKIPEVRGLGSTAAILFIRNGIAYIACAGDSRVYLLRKTQLLQITEDQTIAAALVRTGHLSPETAKSHPLRHALEEYIGKEDQLHPGVWYQKLHEGDRWLLCSDGLTKGLSKHELRKLLLQHSSPEKVCQQLILTAKNRDGTDNITVVIVDIVSLEEPKPSNKQE